MYQFNVIDVPSKDVTCLRIAVEPRQIRAIFRMDFTC
jgi:hypothetical protein